MTITPQGQLYLCKTKLENDYKNQLTFSNATAQLNYFNSIIAHTFDNYTYIKKDNVIQVGKNIDEIIDCNYLFYRNTGFTNKWYYCFITNMEYVNENCTRITFETDCFQTYQFNIIYNECFVEREHVNDDTIGLHTVPENLETGDYLIANKIKRTGFGRNNICFILATTTFPYIHQVNGKWVLDGGNASRCNVYNSILSGLEYFWYLNNANGIERLQHTLEAFDNDGKADAIYMLFTAPDSCFEKVLENPNEGFWGSVKQKQGSYNEAWENATTDPILKPSTINGYTPTNKKLLTYPYCYLLINNGNGGNAMYQYELFRTSGDYCYFYIDSAICPGCSVFLRPYNYKNNDNTNNHMDGLPLGKFPMCSWNSDAYVNWLTQNSVNLSMGYLKDALNIGTSVASKNISGTITNTLDLVSDTLQIFKQRDIMTPQAMGNTNSGDISYSMEETTFTAYQMAIKPEFAYIIDNYFSQFGYKINRIKRPNITGRQNWNYVKTIDCNFDGDMPQTDLNIIRAMFNNGVTLWHNPQTMNIYANPNNII